MPRYLIVAHQTATSPELRKQVKALATEAPQSDFAILIPSTQLGFHLTVNEGAAREASLRRAEEARAMLEETGATVWRTAVGSPHPYDAIADELREHPVYDSIILSTLPEGISRWIGQDLPHKAARLGLPIIHVVSKPRVAAHA